MAVAGGKPRALASTCARGACGAPALGEVVRHTEPDMALVSCFDPINAPCTIQQCCVLQSALGKACLAFVNVLDGYTLSDLGRRRLATRRTLFHERPHADRF